ncbi:serine/threonine-protein kinase [Streptomyces sp. NBC_01294]|uniref:serine/threonine-protein kinase n=1 Tax=Streptomyces sp. NBC_01294 TaxID=2903815 RepID=UPI002DDA9BC5|nr:serine/threonine-protein kinase [Streptomyces sp. NBC_01294]WRZ55398.1 serine/threonine protein kinase [Streptomyces sp. NBC_01294]WRZ61298.1 serine/threonine protein kinase [Streptomyces sp. NBC_01294]
MGGRSGMSVNGAGERLRAEDPREIAGYRLVARIGEGGMGTVYLSRTRGGQPVALKVIRREYGSAPGFRRRFEQEVQAARRVQGYHVVPVVDHDTTGEQPWLASVFVPGLSLHEALAAHGPLPLPAVLQLVGCTARALTAIHAAGIVHRDLKPGNVLLSDQGPYVIDFGIARAADATQLTASGGVVGTPQFMSPEQALGDPVGPAADVFSLGLIAAVAATGRHPYGEGGALTLAAQIANTGVRPPRLDLYDDRLRPLLERCLSADPGARVGAGELAALCEKAAGRSLNDFAGWLPQPLTEELAARGRAARTPTPDPTVTDPGPRPPHGPTFATAPTAAPTEAPTPPPYPPTAPAAPRRTRTGLVVAGTAMAVVLAVVVTWTVAKAGSTADGRQEKGEGKPSGQPSHSTGPAPTPSASAAASDDSGYTVVFRDRPFALRSPSGANIVEADLDVPQVVQDTPGREIQLSEISGGGWEFYTPMGKSAGKTPQQCLQGAQSDVLPAEIKAKDLRGTLPVGALLCTITTDKRLAMLEVTDITTSHGNLPDYATRLTLWQKR